MHKHTEKIPKKYKLKNITEHEVS